MPDTELVFLQRAVAAHRRSGAPRYTPELRARISAWVADRRAHGAWWCDVARPLGIPAQTLVRWSAPAAPAVAMRAVEIIDAPLAGTVTLVAPSGLRIEGVDIATAIAILRGLA